MYMDIHIFMFHPLQHVHVHVYTCTLAGTCACIYNVHLYVGWLGMCVCMYNVQVRTE